MARKRLLYCSALMLACVLGRMTPLPAPVHAQSASADPAPQHLDYTELPVDVPNPDRGFYRANDDMIVPVHGAPAREMEVGREPVQVGGVEAATRISHVYVDLRNFSSNALVARGTEYDEGFFAPAHVSIRSRAGDAAPYAHDTHFAYWQQHVLPAWPHGVSQPLTGDALAFIRNQLQQIRDGEGVALVRFTYDGGGLAWVSCDHPEDGQVDRLAADMEPDRDTVLHHIAQLRPILHEYEDILMAVDGGFFGPWGEMHSTALAASPDAYVWLLNALLDAVPASRSILVHGGAFLSWYNATYHTAYTFADIDQVPAPARGAPASRFGFFNDSYAYGADKDGGPADDGGSLSEGAGWPGDPLGDADSFDRGRVMAWIRRQNNFYGGEAQGEPTAWNGFPFVAWEAAFARTAYLNADYQEDVLSRWGAFRYTQRSMAARMVSAYRPPYIVEHAIFDPVYQGRRGIEYLRDRLGYRLVLRDANASRSVTQDGQLVFRGQVQNVGFGSVVNRKNVSVLLRSTADGVVYTALTALDARDWLPDPDGRAGNTAAYRELSFTLPLHAFGQVPAGAYEIYLKINDPREMSQNKRCIRFANPGLWNAALGANRIGATVVRQGSSSVQ